MTFFVSFSTTIFALRGGECAALGVGLLDLPVALRPLLGLRLLLARSLVPFREGEREPGRGDIERRGDLDFAGVGEWGGLREACRAGLLEDDCDAIGKVVWVIGVLFVELREDESIEA